MKVAIVGAGGNIGSPLVHNVAQCPAVSELILVDPDRYEASNLRHQGIGAADLDRPKSVVQAERVRALRPELPVTAHVATVQSLPAGLLADSILLGALDNRGARQYLNALSCHLGLPYFDGAVSAANGSLIGRLTVLPGRADCACMECSWGPAQYADLAHRYPCSGHTPMAPTNAPAALGAFTAALLALEVEKLAAGKAWDGAEEIRYDLASHRQSRTRLARNPGCRMDHRPWSLSPLALPTLDTPIADVLDHLDAVGVGLPGSPFLERLTCTDCGAPTPIGRFAARIPEAARRCPRCGHDMQPLIGDECEFIDGEKGCVTFSAVGVTPGDVLAFFPANNKAPSLRLVTT